MSSSSASLAVWVSSWLAGVSAPDDVIDAMFEWAPMHLVVAADPDIAAATGLAWPSPRADGIAALLTTVRSHLAQTSAASAPDTDAAIELLLPAPGSVENLAPSSEFSRAAIGAGEAVAVGYAGTRGLGLVPTVEGPDVLRWTVYTVDIPNHYFRDFSLGEAEYAMRDAVRSAAEALGSMQALPTRSELGDPRTRITELIANASRHRYPTETSERVLRVLESADRVAAILSVAQHSSPTEAPTASAAAARESLVRPLWATVRSARLSAVASCIESSVPRR
ncbi:hypothetical protein QMK17_16535 [Rhodococcus sp. G-MC3]|uniref:hypothetical protein n=1 Tax=Rhodococcus sp. G-MC3 TaxID=3046209 RepID=UPI0024BBAD5A|nr:hypothetical protein [Rhodococcus sp. G-MC3]MDJ0394934.1 hypothetical protein [Rhodococcus sp. G-MC3]